MLDPELQNYIATARASGMSDSEIKNNLSAHGWTETQVQEGLVGVAMPSPHGNNLNSASGLNKKVSSKWVMLIGLILIISGVALFYLAIVLVFRGIESENDYTTGVVVAFIFGFFACPSGAFFLISGLVNFIRDRRRQLH